MNLKESYALTSKGRESKFEEGINENFNSVQFKLILQIDHISRRNYRETFTLCQVKNEF